MDIETLQQICTSLPVVTEDIKWEHDLVFSIGNKMFLVLGINELPVSAAFKVNGEEFEELLEREGFTPAPYVAKYKWVKIDHLKRLSKEEWNFFIRQSYNLVKNKLTSKVQKQLGIEYIRGTKHLQKIE